MPLLPSSDIVLLQDLFNLGILDSTRDSLGYMWRSYKQYLL